MLITHIQPQQHPTHHPQYTQQTPRTTQYQVDEDRAFLQVCQHTLELLQQERGVALRAAAHRVTLLTASSMCE